MNISQRRIFKFGDLDYKVVFALKKHFGEPQKLISCLNKRTSISSRSSWRAKNGLHLPKIALIENSSLPNFMPPFDPDLLVHYEIPDSLQPF